jgi:hypothetical protein
MRIASSPRVTKIVFAAFWEGYPMRKTLYLTSDPERRIIDGPGPELDRLFENFETELRSLRSAGKETYIILSNPTVPPRGWQGIPPRLKWSGRPTFAPPTGRSYMDRRTAAVTPLLRGVASRTGTVIIDPMDFLCNARDCPTTTADGMPIFRDGDHLRSGFVSSRAAFIDRIFDR